MKPSSTRPALCHDDAYLQRLFDRMGPTYGLMNVLSSFGFSELWRRTCVANAEVRSGDRVCDMMSGSGECWRYLWARGGAVVTYTHKSEMRVEHHQTTAYQSRRTCMHLGHRRALRLHPDTFSAGNPRKQTAPLTGGLAAVRMSARTPWLILN